LVSMPNVPSVAFGDADVAVAINGIKVTIKAASRNDVRMDLPRDMSRLICGWETDAIMRQFTHGRYSPIFHLESFLHALNHFSGGLM
ncbi:MAG: hypothetical protein P8L39_09620, partial [Halioglobus sp.]|nr:hypothetical protein [Halioglobus sp.]